MKTDIKKIKNIAIVLVCIISIVLSAVNYFKPHKADSAEDYFVFYDTDDDGGTLLQSTAQTDVNNSNETDISETEEINTPDSASQNKDINEDIYADSGGFENTTGTGSESGSGVSSDESSDGKISLNNATLEDLMSLPGIGETKAKAILSYRTQYGSFVSIEELMEVKGIGESTFNKLKPYIKL